MSLQVHIVVSAISIEAQKIAKEIEHLLRTSDIHNQLVLRGGTEIDALDVSLPANELLYLFETAEAKLAVATKEAWRRATSMLKRLSAVSRCTCFWSAA